MAGNLAGFIPGLYEKYKNDMKNFLKDMFNKGKAAWQGFLDWVRSLDPVRIVWVALRIGDYCFFTVRQKLSESSPRPVLPFLTGSERTCKIRGEMLD